MKLKKFKDQEEIINDLLSGKKIIKGYEFEEIDFEAARGRSLQRHLGLRSQSAGMHSTRGPAALAARALESRQYRGLTNRPEQREVLFLHYAPCTLF